MCIQSWCQQFDRMMLAHSCYLYSARLCTEAEHVWNAMYVRKKDDINRTVSVLQYCVPQYMLRSRTSGCYRIGLWYSWVASSPARWSIPFWQPAYRLHLMCTCVFFTWQINSAAAAACYCLRRQFLRPFCGSAVMTSQQRHQDTSVDSNTQVDVVLASQLQHSWKSVICKGKGLNTCYSTAYMSQTGDQQRFTILEVAADWHEPMVPQRIMWPSTARANGKLDPRCR